MSKYEKLVQIGLNYNCPEKIGDMKKISGGMDCSKCCKKVWDFTQMSRSEAKKFYNESSSSVCISYLKAGNGKIIHLDEISKWSFLSFKIFLVLFILLSYLMIQQDLSSVFVDKAFAESVSYTKSTETQDRDMGYIAAKTLASIFDSDFVEGLYVFTIFLTSNIGKFIMLVLAFGTIISGVTWIASKRKSYLRMSLVSFCFSIFIFAVRYYFLVFNYVSPNAGF